MKLSKTKLMTWMLVGVGLSSCSLSSRSKSVQLEIELKTPAASNFGATVNVQSGSLIPQSLSDFSCIAVNVMGADIAQTQLLPSDMRATTGVPYSRQSRIKAQTGCRYPGTLSKTVAFKTGTSVQLTVPSGKSRTIQIIGVAGPKKCPAGAELSTLLEEELARDGEPQYIFSELGAITQDLSGNTSIKIANGFQAGKAKFPFHCLDDIYTYTSFRIIQLAAGYGFTCALGNDARVQCWGKNSVGQLGRGFVSDNVTAPDYVLSLTGVQEIAAGLEHACARLSDGSVSCWGSNSAGQMGIGSVSDPVTRPVSVTQPNVISGVSNSNSSTGTMGGVTQIAAGAAHSCALRAGDTPVCWGAGARGQLGDGSVTSNLYPLEISALAAATQVVSGPSSNTTCAVIGNAPGQSIQCWGAGTSGEVGDGTGTDMTTPTIVAAPFAGTAQSVGPVAVGNGFVCAIADARKYCWGLNTSYQWGSDSAASSSTTPTNVAAATYPAIYMGSAHGCGMNFSTKQIDCWGLNTSGQVGTSTAVLTVGTVTNLSLFSGLTAGISAGTAGSLHSCVSSVDSVYCWGDNTDGALGPNAFGQSSVVSPVRVFPRR